MLPMEKFNWRLPLKNTYKYMAYVLYFCQIQPCPYLFIFFSLFFKICVYIYFNCSLIYMKHAIVWECFDVNLF